MCFHFLYFYVTLQTSMNFFNTLFMLLYDTPIIYIHFTLTTLFPWECCFMSEVENTCLDVVYQFSQIIPSHFLNLLIYLNRNTCHILQRVQFLDFFTTGNRCCIKQTSGVALSDFYWIGMYLSNALLFHIKYGLHLIFQ